MGFWDFLTGTKEKHKRVSTLMPGQQPILDQLTAAAQGKGAGGAFGEAADYYRDLLDPNSATAQMMFAPETRRFNEEIIPGLSEQFAGMGAGGLSSSGFRNAAVGAGTDLSERLGAIRAQLRQQGAAGLAGIGQSGLQNYSQDVMTQAGTPGLLSQIAGPLAQAGVGMAGDWFKGKFSGGNQVGQNTSPYGNKVQSSSAASIPRSSYGLPNFMQR